MRNPQETVQLFFDRIRSGAALDEADHFFAPRVLAHQILSSPQSSIVARSPAEYADHIREMTSQFGPFVVTMEDIFSDGTKVFVRWRQEGLHLGSFFGEEPTGAQLVQRGSAVYRVEGERIVEYWIQLEEAGLRDQIDASVSGANK